jgi:hypothetical protein
MIVRFLIGSTHGLASCPRHIQSEDTTDHETWPQRPLPLRHREKVQALPRPNQPGTGDHARGGVAQAASRPRRVSADDASFRQPRVRPGRDRRGVGRIHPVGDRRTALRSRHAAHGGLPPLVLPLVETRPTGNVHRRSLAPRSQPDQCSAGEEERAARSRLAPVPRGVRRLSLQFSRGAALRSGPGPSDPKPLHRRGTRSSRAVRVPHPRGGRHLVRPVGLS